MLFDGLSLRHWQPQRRDDGIVVLTLDRSDAPVNAVSQAVLDELDAMLERILIEPPKALVIRSGKPGGFAPGADVKEFQSFDASGRIEQVLRRGQAIYQKLATLPLPTVAAIHGHCMGGGAELALACRYRVASSASSTRIALPEIKLGIYPGWGGSVRLPRLIGAPAAMDVMLTGRSVSAKGALAMGVVDKLADPDLLLDVAVHMAGRRLQRPFKTRAVAWATNTWLARQILAPLLVKQVARKARKEHYPAPYALISTWQRSGGGTVNAQLRAEAKSVAKLAKTDTARNLVRIFFLMDRLKSLGGKDGAAKNGGIAHVHVVGAGTMGGDIAAWCAFKGFEVTLQDREMRYIEPALQRADALYAKKIKDDTTRTQTRARLQADVGGAGVARAQLAIEAIFEDLHAKQDLLAGIEPQLQPEAIVASNTSSIPLAQIGEKLARPQRLAGLHFFNPVAMMPLVEIVRHARMDAATEQRLAAFCRGIDKLPIAVAGTPGFLVNRVLFPYLLEAVTAYAEGIPGAAIDKAALRFGMPMGPLELIDTVGLDVGASVVKELAPFLGLNVPAALGAVEAGKRGKKDGQGIYKWENGKAVKPPLPAGYSAPEDLEDRLILPLLNEAVAVLHAGVVDDADLLDAGVIFGTGFAPFRGGPIAHIRKQGADAIKAKLEALQDKYGARFAPRPGWDAPALR